MSYYQICGGHASSDEYYTPACAVEILLSFVPKHWTIWESAWGSGMMADAMKAHGFKVVGGPKINFFQRIGFEWDAIITNPPYSQKFQFIDHALWRGKPWAFLLPLDTLASNTGYRLLHDKGIQLLIPSKRVYFIGGAHGTNFNSAWYCWGFNLPRDLNFVEATW